MIFLHRVDDLKVKLSEATGDKEERELLTVSGQLLESNSLVMDICNRDSKVRKIKTSKVHI